MPRLPSLPCRPTLSLALALPAAVAACAAPGERANTGECPAGEVCSPLTPNGLTFQGLRFADILFDGGLHPMVAGGSQPIEVRYGTSGGGDGTPIFHPYAALPTDDAFTATADRAVVTLAASAPASGRLRIVDDDGLLMDRIAITAAAPAQIHLRAQTNVSVSGRPLALVPDQNIVLVAVVLAADGTRLVDRDLAMSSGGPSAERRTWDSLAITSRSTGFPVTTTSGGLTVEHAVGVASTADRLELQPHDPLSRGTTTTVCLAAVAGTREVVGLTWTWSAPTGAEVTPMTSLSENCAWIRPTTGGPVDVTVAVPGATTRLTLPVGASARRAPSVALTDEGDRARLTDAASRSAW